MNTSMHHYKEITGRDYRTGDAIKITVKEGLIDSVCPVEMEKTATETATSLPYIAPGLVDLQLNGLKGIDLNGEELTPEGVLQIVKELFKEGVTSFFPTVITNATGAISRNLGIIAKACAQFPEVNAAVLGIHLEGPFISAEDGPLGAHLPGFVKAPDFELFSNWQEISGGRIKLVTLSPEWPGSASFIKNCVAGGVKVAIGHTAATRDQIIQAVDAGASLSTHLGNGCHQVLPRYPNYIWNQLAESRLWSSLIADGFHLPEDVLKVFLKVKPDTSYLVSDGTHLTGMPPGIYKTHIGSEVVLDENGRLYIKSAPGTLAGSAKSLLWSITHLVDTGLFSLSDAWNLASLKPIAFLSGQRTAQDQVQGQVEGQVRDNIRNTLDPNQGLEAATVPAIKPEPSNKSFDYQSIEQQVSRQIWPTCPNKTPFEPGMPADLVCFEVSEDLDSNNPKPRLKTHIKITAAYKAGIEQLNLS